MTCSFTRKMFRVHTTCAFVRMIFRIFNYLDSFLDFQNHRQSGADITISCLPMDDRYALAFSKIHINSETYEHFRLCG